MGHRAPYLAVVSISLMAATVWRSLRARLADKGIADPMRQFPHLHALLDFAESVWMESLTTGDEKKDRAAIDRYNMSLYKPDEPVKVEVSKKGRKRVRTGPPPGWGDKASIEQQFDAFASAVTGESRRRR